MLLLASICSSTSNRSAAGDLCDGLETKTPSGKDTGDRDLYVEDHMEDLLHVGPRDCGE